MRNEKYVDNIKAAVDAACGPNVVSCADILAVGAAAGVQVVSRRFLFAMLVLVIESMLEFREQILLKL